jgi:hypothetical protein
MRKVVRGVPHLLLALVADCAGAGGPGEGPPDTTSADWPLTGHLTDPALAGGEVLALSADGVVERAPIGANGNFEVALAGGRAWVLHFARDGAFGATLWVKNFAGGRSTRLRLPERDAAPAGVSALRSMLSADGGAGGDPAAEGGAGGTADAGVGGATDGAVDPPDDGLALGEVTTDGGIATAENDPGDSLDGDGDGIADAADEDSDGSGVPDDLEEEDDDIDEAAVGLVVTHVEPRPDERRVDADTEVEIRFDLPLDPASVTAGAVQLLDEAGAPVAVELALEHEGTELLLVPAAPLVAGATYAVEVGAAVAATGETLAAPFRSTFRVESAEEEEVEQETAQALRVRELEPRHGAEDVALDAVIEVEFNLPLDEATVVQGEAGFALLDPEGVAVPGTLTLERAKRLVFVPGAPLLPSTDYTIAIGAGFGARGPQAIEEAVAFGFRTGTEAAVEDSPERPGNANASGDGRNNRDGDGGGNGGSGDHDPGDDPAPEA